ncbi:Zinc finger protein 91 [Folsomia candida]|uniref:Zinc finger protein 91 n=1 Tax=Folsomia candida TaxID=158441 RepID=A0A226DQZ3_FOLCA|nr:Zinc finger protein 91 [Folsomia candida]
MHHAIRNRPSCDICHRVCSTPSNLRKHVNTVHNKTERPRFPCGFPGCGKTYSSKNALSIHMRAEHAENPTRFPCTLCGKECKAKSDLERHISTHTTEKTYTCSTCGRSFGHRTTLTRHEVTHLETSTRRIFKCELCPHASFRKAHLQTHVQSVHENQRNHPCQFCGKRLSTSSNMRNHVEARHPASKRKIYSCEKCEFITHSKQSLSNHERRHNPANRRDCYFCKKQFFFFSELSDDMIKVGSFDFIFGEGQVNFLGTGFRMDLRPGTKWACSKCSKTLSSKRNLNLHMLTHDPAAKVKCEICRKMLKNQQTLSIHTKMSHTKRDRPRCGLCHREFCTSGNLQRYIFSKHTALKWPRLPCGFPGCGKTYLNSESVSHHYTHYLEAHISTHTTEKAYRCIKISVTIHKYFFLRTLQATHLEKSARRIFKCEHCSHISLSRRDLRMHIRIVHEKQRNHHCTFCDKSFLRSSDMRLHLEARHPANKEKIHSCDRCEFMSRSQKSLAKHVRRHNPANRRECYFCQKQFFYFTELVRHFHRHALEM